MGKKEKSKHRLDKFYHIAKEQGFRSRAAFKLIQINKKYNFLKEATVLIDLCAAPGGWLQVASKYMQPNSIILGIDLDPIKAVPNCKTFQEDITTPKCVALIRKELKTMKADVVLNDGAPNVGANWNRDAYVQAELVLASLKLATEVLRKGGWFVTKVFRSADYHSLIWVMSKFFDKVEATKPEASRSISAEIFVVGIGFRAPDYIDKKFFDPRQVFKDNEANLAEYLSNKEVNSVDKVFEIRNRRRRVISESETQSLSKKITLEQFIETDSPYAVFVDCTQITISPQDHEKYMSICKPPAELSDWCKDLLLLGKREISLLIKWRAKIRDTRHKEKQATFEKMDFGTHDKEDEEDEVDPEEELYRIEKKERRAQEKLKEKKMLAFAKQSQSGVVKIAASDLERELADFDFDTYGELMRKGEVYTDFQAEEAEDDERLRELGGRYHEYRKKQVKPNSEEEVMDNLEYLYEMKRERKEQAEQRHKEKVAEKLARKKRFLGGEEDHDEEDTEKAIKMERMDDKEMFLRKRALDETANRVEVDDLRKSKWFDRDIFDVLGPRKKQVVQDAEDDEDLEGDEEGLEGDEEEDLEGEEEELEGEDAMDEDAIDDEGVDAEDMDEEDVDEDEGDEEGDEEELDEEDEDDEEPADEAHALDGDHDYEILGHDANDDEMMKDLENSQITKKDIKRLNRMKAYERKEKEEAEGLEPEPEQEEDIAEVGSDIYDGLTLNQKKLLKLKEKNERKIVKNSLDNSIRVVPQKKFEDFDVDELAADLALAKKMLRKKDRENILDLSFNKFNNFDYEGLPGWFVEDEKKHQFLNLPITKEEVQEMRDELRTLNEKPVRKVLEAKFRKKKKLEKQLRKFKKKADQVFEDEGLDERSKTKEVRKLKHKIVTADKNKNAKKKIIVGKRFKIQAPGKKTSGRKYRIVDNRARKDLRAEKRLKRKSKASGGKRGKR